MTGQDQAREARDVLAQAIGDPGSFVKREPGESVPRWAVRAVEAAGWVPPERFKEAQDDAIANSFAAKQFDIMRREKEHGWDEAERMEAQRDAARAALQAIAGPADSGPWIEVYRDAGGGYEGLQAIARRALAGDA